MIETTRRGGVAVLTIDMPGRSMNVLTQEFADAFEAALDAVVADVAVTGIVVTSGKPAFLAGADLAQMAGFAHISAAEVAYRAGRYSRLFRKLETCGKPVVGAAPGTALGGGLELLLACHYRVVADDPKAKIGLPEVTLGLLPGAGGTQRLPRLIGVARALPILTQGKPMGPRQALEAGIVDGLAPADAVLEHAEAVLRAGQVKPVQPWDEDGFTLPGDDADRDPNGPAARRIHAATGGNYPAPLAILRCLYDGAVLPMDDGLALEVQAFVRLIQNPVAHNMIRTLFFAKQAADKLKRRPQGVPASKVARLGVIGAGFMGAGIAEASALAGIDVVLVDADRESAQIARDNIARSLQKALERGRLRPAAGDAALARITAAGDVSGLSGCDMVIEAVPEQVALKAEVTAAAEAAMPQAAVLASNTSALPIDELAAASSRPDKFIGLHFFSPVARMALVEVVVGRATSDETLARALDYVRQIRKTPIVVNDGYGFYTTRCVTAYLLEGLRLLADGIDPLRIEAAGAALGLPVGPLALADEVGIDVFRHVVAGLRERHAGAAADDRLQQPGAILEQAVSAGRNGRKAGAGFYAYPAGQPKTLDRAFLAAYKAADEQPDEDSIKNRLLYAQVLEAARCWEEGIIADAGEADLGAVLGWAFPAYLGGPLAVIDNLGIDAFLAQCNALAQTQGLRFEPPARLGDSGAQRFHAAA